MIGAITGQMIMSQWVSALGWQSTLSHAVWIGLILSILLFFMIRPEKTSQHTVRSFKKVGLELWTIAKTPMLWINAAIGCLMFLPISAFAEMWAVPYLSSLGFERALAAQGACMVFVGYAIGGPIWGVLSNVWKKRKLPILIGAFLSAGCCMMLLCGASLSIAWIYGLLLCMGAFASAQILTFAIANDITPIHASASAAAFTNTVVMLGGVIMLPLIGWGIEFTANYAIILWALPLSLVLAGIACFWLKESYS
jgi:MFS family permease